MASTRNSPKRSSSRVWKAVGACALTGTTLALAAPRADSLPEAMARRGLQVAPTDVRWLDPPRVGPRRALVLAAERGGQTDLYAVIARTGARDAIVSLDDVSNLTRSPDAAEEHLLVAGRWAAFTTRVDRAFAAITVVDTAGSPDARVAAPGEVGARLRAGITRWQQSGRFDGYGIERYDLTPHARRLAVTLRGERIQVDADGRAVTIDMAARRVVAGERHVQSRPRLAGSSSWLTWAVDTVRAVPWIGGEPIAWAEHIAFGMKNRVARARNRVQGDRTQSEVAEDLADVLPANGAANAEGRVEDWPPPPLRTLLSPPAAREGTWSSASPDDPFIARNVGAPAAFLQTFVRTDRERPDTRVYITLWDARQVEMHVVPGSQEPMGATGETGTGTIPRDPRTMTRVAAGFNGGFQALHGEWGVYAEGTLFLPPKPWGATMLALEDGATGFGSWPNGAPIPAEVGEFRQNLTALVEDGVFNPFRRSFWGGNVPSAAPGDEHTTRTGICLTREGHVAFFYGDDLTPRSLADGMIAARCAFGLHLDMNGSNTGFEFIRVTPERATPVLGRPLSAVEVEGNVPSAPGYRYRVRRMVRGMHETLPRYIKRDPRDFFYLMMRAVLPGGALVPPVSPPQPHEGEWHVAGLGDHAFPWPMARTRVRPDAAHPERWVNLVRLDARRMTLGPAEAPGAPVARVVGATPATGTSLRLAWIDRSGASRWSIGTEGTGLAGAPLIPGMAVTRAVGIDTDGFLVYAVADRAQPDLVARALDLAGCRPERMALTGQTAFALTADRDIAGAAIDPHLPPTYALTARAMRGGVRMFPEVRPVPPSVWYDAQHRRVRYRHGEGGTVEVNLVGGHRVSAPMWGTSGRPAGDAGAAAPSAPR